MLDESNQNYLRGRKDACDEAIRTVDNKPLSSIKELSTNSEQLLVRMLMLSIEIDRKDTIIQQLLMTVSHQQEHEIINELSLKCQKYQMDIATLNETVTTLRDTISEIDSFKSKDTFTSIYQINEELETKVRALQTSLRKEQNERIELQQSLKNIKINQTKTQYQLIKNQQNQKAKVRELETSLINERTRIESEKRSSIQKSSIIEQLRSKVTELENRERFILQQNEDRIRLFQSEMIFNDNMKKSQITSTEQKISASVQEISRLKEEITYLKQNIEELKEVLQLKGRDVNNQMGEYKSLQMRLFKQQSELRESNAKLEGKMQQILHKDREAHQKELIIKSMQADIEQFKLGLANREQEVNMYNQEIGRLKSELSDLYNQVDSQKIEIRKLKRRPTAQSLLCESCKIKQSGSTIISSQKSIAMVNMTEIIEQTQALIRSNKKIQSLITQREMNLDQSVHVYQKPAQEL